MTTNTIDILKIGENQYTKVKYSPLEIASIATEYISYRSINDISKLNDLLNSALRKISVNGHYLSTDLEINNHFAKFPNELLKVRTWALLEGLQHFLDSFFETPGLEEQYFTLTAQDNQKTSLSNA